MPVTTSCPRQQSGLSALSSIHILGFINCLIVLSLMGCVYWIVPRPSLFLGSGVFVTRRSGGHSNDFVPNAAGTAVTAWPVR
jgi:hypothetical protein